MKIEKITPKVIFYSSLAVVGGVMGSCDEENGSTTPLEQLPNVLLVVVDDFGWGHFAPNKDQYSVSELNQELVNKVGYDPGLAQRMADRATPTLKYLSENGIRFVDAYTSSNVSSPSRAGILTSAYQERFGFYNLADGKSAIDKSVTLMPSLMQKRGYVTANFGKVHYLPQESFADFKPGLTPNDMGFDYFFGFNYNSSFYYNSQILYNNYGKVLPVGYLTDQITDETIQFIDKNKDQPKMLYVAYNAVHSPLTERAPEEYAKLFTDGTPDLNIFYSYVYAFDQGIRRIMDKLDELGQLDNTIIIFLSDNGAAAPFEGDLVNNKPASNSPLPSNGPYNGFKGETWNGGIKTAMTINWGDKIKKGSICKSMVSSLDIFPTIFEATGISKPLTQPVDGVSLMPIINGDIAYAPHREMFWMCQNGDFFTLNPTDDDPSNAYASFIVRRDNWALRYLFKDDSYELYDVASDRGQQNNIANSNPEIVASMTASFKDWYKDMKEPKWWEKSYWQGMNEKFK